MTIPIAGVHADRECRKSIAGSPRPVEIGLVQINNSFSNQNYFPYSIGLLQAYAQKHLQDPSRCRFRLPIYCRLPVEEGVAQLAGAHVAFFSTYVWNIRISLEIARRLKERNPAVLTVFGGPQVPNRVTDFLHRHPFIDVAVHGEGEQVFHQILERGIFGDWTGIPGISWIDPDGVLVQRPMGPRLKSLADVPSPYLEGTFDPLIRAYPDETWIVMWETNRGCPFSCTFCDWGSAIASKVYQFDFPRIQREIDWFAARKIEFIFCADANFGILPRDLDIVQYAARSKTATGYPKALSVQNTKNATERAYNVQKVLADAGLNKGVTISFQSVDPVTLKSIKRDNISTRTFQELQRRFTRDRVETYSDMILALPGETYDSFAGGVSTVIESGQHNRIQFNNLSVLPNAEMGDPEYQQKYGMTMVETKVVNIHGSLVASPDEIYETQELVVGTHAMPPADWVRTRAFSWMTALLHFDKILQLPLIVAHETCGVSYRELIEVFSEGTLEGLPTLAEVRDFFRRCARDIQNGGAEYCRSEEWLNIWWPADEYLFIKLTVEDRMGAFYDEAERALAGHLKAKFLDLSADLLHDAIALNRSLLKKPFQTTDLDVEVGYNLWEFYRGVLTGEGVPLEKRPRTYHVDRTGAAWFTWDDWFREVVWYGNKKGAYLYANREVEKELAGHY